MNDPKPCAITLRGVDVAALRRVLCAASSFERYLRTQDMTFLLDADLEAIAAWLLQSVPAEKEAQKDALLAAIRALPEVPE